MSFFAELQRRNVVKVAVAYIVASWLLLQLAEVLTELLELSTDVGKMVILLLVIGFVPTVVFAWIFELTPEGIKRESEVDRSQSIVSHTGRKLNRAFLPLIRLGRVKLAIDSWWQLTEAGRGLQAQNTMGVIWYALDREHLKHPAVLPWLEKAGVADYWRIAGDPDYCHRSGETFECG